MFQGKCKDLTVKSEFKVTYAKYCNNASGLDSLDNIHPGRFAASDTPLHLN